MKILICLMVTLLLHSCSQINERIGLPDDNVVEEVVEDVIKGRTGKDIDLTPTNEES